MNVLCICGVIWCVDEYFMYMSGGGGWVGECFMYLCVCVCVCGGGGGGGGWVNVLCICGGIWWVG